MNYFELYQLPVSFVINASMLKRQFYRKSRQYHPDFFATQNSQAQEKALELSTLNNKAYQTLKNLDSRIKYILQLNKLLPEGERYQLPQSFLMDMMDINEALMELQFDPDKQTQKQLSQQVQSWQQQLFNAIQPILQAYQHNNSPQSHSQLKKIKDYYYKKRYLLRISESLDKFAA